MSTAPTKEPKQAETNPWAEYERRKAQLSDDLTPQEYLRECRKIAEELGI